MSIVPTFIGPAVWRQAPNDPPDCDILVLVVHATQHHYHLACWDGTGWFDPENGQSVRATHWMELPEPISPE